MTGHPVAGYNVRIFRKQRATSYMEERAMTDGLLSSSKQFYQIRIDGVLAETWSAWFEGLDLEYKTGSSGMRTTVLTGTLDQSALHGILAKIRDLNLKLISISATEAP
jgi:hypothetical protein